MTVYKAAEEPRRTAPKPQPGDRSRSRRGPGIPKTIWAMVVPAFVLFFVFHTIPVLTGIFFSFTNFAGYGEWQFVGFSNYVNLFQDERVFGAYQFTFWFALVTTVLVNVIALAIAVGLNARIRLKTTFRAVFFLPHVLAILVIGYVFNYMFSNSLPYVAQQMGITALSSSILANESLAWVGIVILAVWQAAAFNIILYLAGLQTIPTEVYEAAGLDGASPRQQFFRITFPLIGAFFTINMVLSLKNFLQVFDHIIALTNGGPGTATESISLLIYRGGLQGGEYAYQTANAVIYLIVIVGLALVQFRILRSREASF
jgi:raffinose/stachyose/melibiose transport system permease protein